MDWTAAKERNCEALLRVLALMFVSVGIVRGGSVATLPRWLRLNVLRELRPAESTLRRLIAIAAQQIVVTLSAVSSASRSRSSSRDTGKRNGKRKPSFPLIEPLQRTGSARSNRARHAPGPGPRMSFFDGSDPVIEEVPPPSPDDLMDATSLCNRLNALQDALDNLPKFALRYAHWQAKRDAAGSGRSKPLRPGRPPGHRARAVYEIDKILQECHELALYALHQKTPSKD